MYVLGYPLLSAVTILDALLLIYTFVIIAHAVLSWINPDPSNPLVRILANLTEPVTDKVRSYIPLVGGLDLTPLVVILVIFFVRSGILPIISQFARDLI
ncbi:MAG TPA: YggT family protein [Alphaproteobacteria bacterium]|nr:YggT family protein [Alphaproteobacteria bacterium]